MKLSEPCQRSYSTRGYWRSRKTVTIEILSSATDCADGGIIIMSQMSSHPVRWGGRIIVDHEDDLPVRSVESGIFRGHDSGLRSINQLEPERRLLGEPFGKLLRLDVVSLPYYDDFVRQRHLGRQAPKAIL
jgi:hypothetical protein